MKLPIYDLQQKKHGEKNLPRQFEEEYRPDLIKRAVHALESSARQKYGTSPEAGMRHSSHVSKRRRDYKGCYGFGVSRVNRKVLSRRGMRMVWVGAFSSQTRGGRVAHPPKAEKNLQQEINTKERRKAIRSAMAATLNKNLVSKRGHHLPENYPFIVTSSVEEIAKTNEVEKALIAIGFKEELERSLIKKIRAGIGKMRGRKYRRKKGLLLVVGGDCPLLKSARNLSGLDVVKANALNVKLLAPGTMPGRVTLWTEKAIDLIKEKNLFI